MTQAENYLQAADWVQSACSALEMASLRLDGRPTCAVATALLRQLRQFEAELRGREEVERRELPPEEEQRA